MVPQVSIIKLFGFLFDSKCDSEKEQFILYVLLKGTHYLSSFVIKSNA